MSTNESTPLNTILVCPKINHFCSLLDIGDHWKSVAVHTSVPLEQIEKITNNRLLCWKSPSRELFILWKNDPNATVERLFQILQKLNLNDALSILQLYTKENGNISVDTIIKRKRQKLFDESAKTTNDRIPGEVEYEQGMVWYWKDCFQDSIPYFDKSAEFNYPPAFLRLGMVHFRMKSMTVIPQYAQKCKPFKDWFMERALTGDAIAQYHMGMYFDLIENDSQQEVYWQQLSAEQGFAPAQNNIGTYYHENNNFEKAAYWFQKASDQGYMRSQCSLAYLHEVGHGVKQDYGLAAKLYQNGAEQGDADSLCSLGWCYEYGKGVELNAQKAFECYKAAAEQGSPRGSFSLALCYEDGVGVPKDQQLALSWYEKSATENYSRAQYNLGLCYHRGDGVKQDFVKAAYWFQKASELGHDRAPRIVGTYYANGSPGFSIDLKKAFQWYEKSAMKGFAWGQFDVGECYYYGKGVRQDYEKALYWYQKAVDGGVPGALAAVGRCYEYGNGIAQDHEQARVFFKKSQNYKKCLSNWKAVHRKEKCRKEEPSLQDEE